MVSLAVLALALAVAQQEGGGPLTPPPRFAAVVPHPHASASALQSPAAVPPGVPIGADGAVGAVTRPEAPAAVPADTPAPRARPRAVEYSDWYARRLAVHRVASYALLPLLGLQYYTGTQLMAKGSDAPLWVIRSHGPLATTSAAVFGVNTVTGVWNLWDARKDPNGRASRTVHGLLMLASDAGFLVAGSLGHPAVQDGSKRSLHRTIAISSMGVALVGYAIMLPPFRR